MQIRLPSAQWCFERIIAFIQNCSSFTFPRKYSHYELAKESRCRKCTLGRRRRIFNVLSSLPYLRPFSSFYLGSQLISRTEWLLGFDKLTFLTCFFAFAISFTDALSSASVIRFSHFSKKEKKTERERFVNINHFHARLVYDVTFNVECFLYPTNFLRLTFSIFEFIGYTRDTNSCVKSRTIFISFNYLGGIFKPFSAFTTLRVKVEVNFIWTRIVFV